MGSERTRAGAGCVSEVGRRWCLFLPFYPATSQPHAYAVPQWQPRPHTCSLVAPLLPPPRFTLVFMIATPMLLPPPGDCGATGAQPHLHGGLQVHAAHPHRLRGVRGELCCGRVGACGGR
mgnify:CR=1 FL=1